MQFYNQHLIARFGLLFLFAALFTGCLKKIEEADNLNTNIFDRDYAGDQWYVIDDYYQFTNELGQIKTRVEVIVPSENTPDLKSSSLKVEASGSGYTKNILNFNIQTGGDYEGIIDLPYNGLVTYCIELGIYIEEEEEAINSFEDCFQL